MYKFFLRREITIWLFFPAQSYFVNRESYPVRKDVPRFRKKFLLIPKYALRT